jgi:hypothetical protein
MKILPLEKRAMAELYTEKIRRTFFKLLLNTGGRGHL